MFGELINPLYTLLLLLDADTGELHRLALTCIVLLVVLTIDVVRHFVEMMLPRHLLDAET